MTEQDDFGTYELEDDYSLYHMNRNSDEKMNYIIVKALSLESLIIAVNQKIDLGYIPSGSIIVTAFNQYQPASFAQPMLKIQIILGDLELMRDGE